MSILQRKYTRFSLEIPAVIYTKFGERHETMLQQISIGGCFTGWEENIFPGDVFRLEIELPNKNRLPLTCKAIYRFENSGIGVKFIDVSGFEQSLVTRIVSGKLAAEGLPMPDDLFSRAATPEIEHKVPQITNERHDKEEMLERIMSGDDGS
jgi:hypothetical protein